ncbi:cache domain-containing protein, partial [Roseateles sp. P5_E11]
MAQAGQRAARAQGVLRQGLHALELDHRLGRLCGHGRRGHLAARLEGGPGGPKVSYVKGFTPWSWIIGSGVYVDTVDAAIWQRVWKVGLG